MPLTKAKGNMYPWVTHTHSHLGGECPHKCSYCYVQAIAKRFKQDRYQGPLRFVEKELAVNYGSGRTIFVEHCNDLWANETPPGWIKQVLAHCSDYPDNLYVFQTKNPGRYNAWLPLMPPRRLLGCTIETTDWRRLDGVSEAPSPLDRYLAMRNLARAGERTFLTVEPIMDGNMRLLAEWITDIDPEFVNIGADSKGTGLNEPSAGQVRILLGELQHRGIEVRRKMNLSRLLRAEPEVEL